MNSSSSLNSELTTSLRVVLPVIYIVFAFIGVIGNLIVLQIICANRFRHKSIHLLVSSLVVADTGFIVIFTVIRALSYAYSNTSWFVNVDQWCKAEMYLLRLFEFVLAYTVVFVCLDRAVPMGTCWFGVRKFRAGLSVVFAIWISSIYVLIPILLFSQTQAPQIYGGYLCYTTDQSVTLYWLGQNPRRILDFIDIMFRIMLPIFLMLILLPIGFYNVRKASQESGSQLNRSSNNVALTLDTTTASSTYLPISKRNTKSNSIAFDLLASNRRYFLLALAYAVLFAVCQLPFEIYRCVMLWNQTLELSLSTNGTSYAIEIPLLILKLINRCVNPFLFICLGDIYGYRKNFMRCWMCPCLPGCTGCNQCWCFDCWRSIANEWSYCVGEHNESIDDEWVPTGLQTISTHQYRDGEKLVTKQHILEEYETGVEAYYKNPGLKDSLAVSNEAFDNDDNLRTARSVQLDEQLRAKL